jgi:polyisoprenoid-binding protein YceI
MASRYRLDPNQSRFTVQAFATGMLSMLGHSPTFAAREFGGEMRFAGSDVKDMQLELTVDAHAIDLLDRVKDADRREIMDRMRRDVLEVSAYPKITFQSAEVLASLTSPDRYNLQIGGRLTLHGVTLPHLVVGEFFVYKDGVRFRGETALRMSDYRIKPVSALGGTIKLEDAVKLAFDIVGLPEDGP